MPSAFDKEVGIMEKMLKYRYWRRAEELPARAAQIAAITDRPNLGFCVRNHDEMAYAGPPFPYMGSEMRYVCVTCGSVASWDECRERGFEFQHTPDFVIHDIMDLKLIAQKKSPNRLRFFAKKG